MPGYIRKRKEIGGSCFWGLILMTVLVPTHALAQTRAAPPGDHPKTGKVGAIKKHTPEQTFVPVGAGDIAACKNLAGAKATAKLTEQIPGTVFAAEDLAYERGSAETFKNCYDQTWGCVNDRTNPHTAN